MPRGLALSKELAVKHLDNGRFREPERPQVLDAQIQSIALNLIKNPICIIGGSHGCRIAHAIAKGGHPY